MSVFISMIITAELPVLDSTSPGAGIGMSIEGAATERFDVRMRLGIVASRPWICR